MDREEIISNPKGKANSRYIKIHYPNEYKIIINYKGNSFAEKLYNYLYNSPNHTCKVCGKETNFHKLTKGYFEYCSVACSYKSKERSDKSKKTTLERYGVENPSQSEEIKQKKRETFRKKFIGYNPFHIGYTEDGDWICCCPHQDCDKCVEKQFIINQCMYHDRIRNKSELCTKLLLPGKQIKQTTLELFVQEILQKHNIEFLTNVRDVLNGSELDIYIPSNNIAIECNGVYWHSLKDPSYHINKFKKCCDINIQLITLWEDWIKNKPQIVESIIKSKLGLIQNKVYARNCIIKEVDFKESKVFLNENHIQGYSNSSIRIGLYFNDELVSLMTFGKSRLGIGKQQGGYELIRFCNKINTCVVGGASKLLSFFTKLYKPSKIYSYSSNDISNGNLYQQLGFVTNNKISRAYWYINNSSLKRHHRFYFNKHQLQKMGFDTENKTEFQIMEDLPYFRIFDTGLKKWVLNL